MRWAHCVSFIRRCCLSFTHAKFTASIRAYGAQSFFREALKKKVNLYTRASLALYDTNRWIAVRVETLGGLFAGSVSVYFIYGSNMSAGYIGFTLSMLVNFSRLVLIWVRVYNDFELKCESIYSNLQKPGTLTDLCTLANRFGSHALF